MAGFLSRGASSNQGDIWSLVAVMTDPDRFRSHLSDLLAAEKRLDEKIGLAGAADEIVALRITAQKNQDDSVAQLNRAEAECAKLKEAAQKQATKIIAEATERAQLLEEQGRFAHEQGKLQAGHLTNQAQALERDLRAVIAKEQAQINELKAKLASEIAQTAQLKQELTASKQTAAAHEAACAAKLQAVQEQLALTQLQEAAHLKQIEEITNQFTKAVQTYQANKKR